MQFIVNSVENGDMKAIISYGLFEDFAVDFFFTRLRRFRCYHGVQSLSGLRDEPARAMMERIQNFSFSNLDRFSTAGIVTRMTTDVSNVQMAFQMMIRICFRAPIMLVSALVMSFVTNWQLAFIFVAAIVVLGGLLAVITSTAFPRFKYVFEKYDGVNASVQENLTGIRVVKAYVREDHETGKFHKASDFLYKCFVRAEKVVVMNGPIMNFTMYACIIALSFFGAKLIVGSGGAGMTTGALTTFLSYSVNILMNLMMISMIFVMLTMAKTSAERIVEVLDEPVDLQSPENP